MSKILVGEVLDEKLRQYNLGRKQAETDWDFRTRAFVEICARSREEGNLRQALDILMGEAFEDLDDMDKALYEDFLGELQSPRSKFYDPKRLTDGFHGSDLLESRTTRKRFIAQRDPLVESIEELFRHSRHLPKDTAR